MKCDMCELRIPGEKPNECINELCYECWLWIE